MGVSRDKQIQHLTKSETSIPCLTEQSDFSIYKLMTLKPVIVVQIQLVDFYHSYIIGVSLVWSLFMGYIFRAPGLDDMINSVSNSACLTVSFVVTEVLQSKELTNFFGEQSSNMGWRVSFQLIFLYSY